MSEKKELPNVKVLRQFLLKGVPQEVGTVISKKSFDNAGDWQNLAHMKPARVEETDDPVGKGGKSSKSAAPSV